MPPKKKEPKQKKRFCLLRWITEESVSVVRDDTAKKGMKVFVGAYCDFKWSGKFYQAEVLKISSDRQLLLKDCDRLTQLEATREDFLAMDEAEIDSTTDCEGTPVKIVKKAVPKKTTSAAAKNVKHAQIEAAKGRAQAMFKAIADDEAEKLKEEVRSLKEQLARKRNTSPSVMVTQNKISRFEIDATTNYIDSHQISSDMEYDFNVDFEQNSESGYEGNEDSGGYCHNHETPIRPVSVRSRSMQYYPRSTQPHSRSTQPHSRTTQPLPLSTTQLTPIQTPPGPKSSPAVVEADPENGAFKVQVKPIELVEGYGVFLTKKQLDAALDASKGSPSRLIRCLMSVFFKPDVLAVSSACGTRKHPALDGDIVQACIRFVQGKYEHVSKSTLTDCINDKCANFRRKLQ